MQVCLFLTGASGAEPLLDANRLQHAARHIEGLRALIVHEPIAGRIDPLIAPAADAPSCVLQWYFDELAPLEAASERDGAIHRALAASAHAALTTRTFTQQAMAVRTLAPSHAMPPASDAPRCTYLVGYEGVAEDFNAWLTHYLLHHPPLMQQLPGLRELEIYTRIDCTSGLPFAHAHALQRNKVVFDNPSALVDALASPVRDAMRRDFHALPPYQGTTPHFAMHSIYGNLASH